MSTQKRISGYTIFLDKILGAGSFGKVYRAEQDKTKAECAVKMLDKRKIDEDSYMKNALFSEIKAMQSIKSPNVVGFMDVMESSNNYYIILELCDGGSLDKVIKDKGCLSEEQAIELLKQICNGFLAIIREGVIHRDLKPANVMISKGAAKIGDFGFAKKNFNKKMLQNTRVGTPLYMPIQMLKDQPYTSKCDIWALGFIFYEMLHGHTPWTAKTEYELIQNIEKKPLKIAQKFNPHTINFLQRCLAIMEPDRFSWDQLFLHPIFKGFFQNFLEENKAFENKLKKVMIDLRFTITSQNIDLVRVFETLGFEKTQSLRFEDFARLIKSIQPSTAEEELIYFFERMDINNDGSVSLIELEKEMQLHMIPTQRKDNMEPISLDRAMTMNEDIDESTKLTAELELKARNCFIKLYKILTKKGISLYQTFVATDTHHSGQLTLTEFSKIMTKLDVSFTKQELMDVFRVIDLDGSESIDFEELNWYYCKVNGLPEHISLPEEYMKKKRAKNQTNNPIL